MSPACGIIVESGRPESNRQGLPSGQGSLPAGAQGQCVYRFRHSRMDCDTMFPGADWREVSGYQPLLSPVRSLRPRGSAAYSVRSVVGLRVVVVTARQTLNLFAFLKPPQIVADARAQIDLAGVLKTALQHKTGDLLGLQATVGFTKYGTNQIAEPHVLCIPWWSHLLAL